LSEPIKIVIADDHQIIRQGLRSLLKSQPGVEVVAEAEDGRSAVKLAAELEPDVVVMDINMPDLNGIDATRQITHRNGGQPGHSPKVVGLSAYSDRRFTMEMLNAGASGFVVKDAAFVELAEAIRTVVSDKVYLSPSIAGFVVEPAADNGPAEIPSAFSQLSPREREILQLTAEGKAMKEIAVQLDISIKTVETHRRKVMEKLGMDSVAELTKYAIREGLTSL
jgi:DNA-binding NarL/FixJ family response regulator